MRKPTAQDIEPAAAVELEESARAVGLRIVGDQDGVSGANGIEGLRDKEGERSELLKDLKTWMPIVPAPARDGCKDGFQDANHAARGQDPAPTP